jgi:hypothetical protein
MKTTVSFVLFFVIGIFGSPSVMSSVSDHVTKIEISTTYDYGTPGDPTSYEFDAWIQVDQTVVSGTLQTPSENVYPLVLEEDGERWLGFSFSSFNLDDLDDFGDGTYTFMVVYSNETSDSTSIDYTLPNGDPIPPVTQVPAFLYPLQEATDVPLAISFQFDPASDPNLEISLTWEPEDESLEPLDGEVDRLPYNTSSYGPVVLSPNIYYDVEVVINRAVWTVNADGIPSVVDKDAERDLYFTTTSNSSHEFREIADLNFDGHINFLDLAIIASHWLESPDENH